MEIENTDDVLPDEEDIYGVNEINEHDSDYWMPAEARMRRRVLILRAMAVVLAAAFAGAAVWLFR